MMDIVRGFVPIVYFFIAMFAAVMLMVFVSRRTKSSADSDLIDKFKAKSLLSNNEMEFLGRLEEALPEYRILAQVAMGALLDPDVSRKNNAKEFLRLRGMFAQKIVDFVVQSRTDGTVVAIIELDDRTHNAEKDARRDAMLADAGYRTIRWDSRRKPDAATIRQALFQGTVVSTKPMADALVAKAASSLPLTPRHAAAAGQN